MKTEKISSFLALSVIFAAATLVAPAVGLAQSCDGLFQSRLADPGLRSNQFVISYFHSGAGRNSLTVAHLLESANVDGVVYFTVTSSVGGWKIFDSRLVFGGVEPRLIRAKFTDPNDIFRREITDLVSVIAARNTAAGREFVGRLSDGRLVRILDTLGAAI